MRCGVDLGPPLYVFQYLLTVQHLYRHQGRYSVDDFHSVMNYDHNNIINIIITDDLLISHGLVWFIGV